MKHHLLLASVLVCNLAWSQSIDRIVLPSTQDYSAAMIRLPSQSYLFTSYATSYGPYYENTTLVSRDGLIVSENYIGTFDRPYSTNLLNGPNGSVYSGSNSSDYAGVYQARVRKLNSKGTLEWQVNTSDSDYSVGTSMILCNNSIFLGVSEKAVIDYQPDQPLVHFITRIDSTGTIAWKYYIQDTAVKYLGTIMELNSDHIVLTAYNSDGIPRLICITKDGNAVWEKSYPSIPIQYWTVDFLETNNGIIKWSQLETLIPGSSVSNINSYLINQNGDFIHHHSYSIPVANIIAISPKSSDSYLVIASNIAYNSFDYTPSDTICSILTTDTSGNILTQFELKNTSYSQPSVNDVFIIDSNKIGLWVTLANGSAYDPTTIYQSEIIEIGLLDAPRDTKANAQNIITTPNPTGRNISLSVFADALPGNLVITDAQGTIITTLNIQATETAFTLEDAPAGLYFLHYQSSNGEYITTKKILITEY